MKNRLLDEDAGGAKGKILVIDDDPEIGWIFSKILSEYGYETASGETESDGIKKSGNFRLIWFFWT